MSSKQLKTLRRRIRVIPDSPGVYIMKDERGRVIYVGKAKSLKSRVRSYFQKQESFDIKTQALVRNVAAVDYIATRNEIEALVLECTLIKEHRPRYNIRLKDDKRYPFIKLTLGEQFPRLLVVRNIADDGSEYFGPYTDAGAVRRTLRLINSIFPLRNCIGKTFTKRQRECLNFHINRCLSPCTGRVEESVYRELVDQVRLFLRGRTTELIEALRERMERLSAEKQYEAAALVRDQIAAIEKITERQLAVSPGGEEEDVIALARERNRSCAVVIKIREGKILGTEAFIIPVSEGIESERVIDSFLELYYHAATDIPRTIVLQREPPERGLIERWLSGKTGRRVRLTVPKRGDRARLVSLAYKNAVLKVLAEIRPSRRMIPVLDDMKEALELPATPFRIEAFDVSNIQGTEAVGSMVTFIDGKPRTSGYRRFKIRGVRGSNDVAMIAEIIRRRIKRVQEEGGRIPDLIMVDGGAGQVSAARKMLDRFDLPELPVIGLAKKHEEIYREGRKEPLTLPPRGEALRLLQRIRNEAHRFAVEYHRKLRSRKLASSRLDEIPGIGEKRKRALLKAFGSIGKLAEATVTQIAGVPGIGVKRAEAIYKVLRHR